MELIPFIYTVLLVVVVLTILTLIVSTIGYRVRRRKNENITNNNGSTNFLELSVKVETPLKSDPRLNEARPVSSKNEPISVSRQKESRPASKQSDSKQIKSVKEKIGDDGKRKLAQRDHSKGKLESHMDRPKIQNERISVLKNLSAQQTQEVIPPTTKKKTNKDNTRALGDAIFDKYNEGDDNDMFTLKVMKDKEHSKDNK